MGCGNNPAVEEGYQYSVASSAWGDTYNTCCKYRWGEPTTDYLRAGIQQALKDVGRYSGPVDGVWGSNTVKGIQCSCYKGKYYFGPRDGIPGGNTVGAVCRYAAYWSAAPSYLATRLQSCPTLDQLQGGTGRHYGDDFWYSFWGRLSMASWEPC